MYAQIAAFATFGAGTIAGMWWAEGGASASRHTSQTILG